MTWSNPERTKENIELSIKQMEVHALKLFDLKMTITSGFLEKMNGVKWFYSIVEESEE